MDFQRGGVSQFISTTWAGYVGILTGVAPSKFAVSVNFRFIITSPQLIDWILFRATTKGTFWTNISSAISYSWPVGFLVRETLATANSYSEAVEFLSNSSLIAPCYLTIAGSKPKEGKLITRNTKGEENPWLFSEKGVIVQTNIDHWSSDPVKQKKNFCSIYKQKIFFPRMETFCGLSNGGTL